MPCKVGGRPWFMTERLSFNTFPKTGLFRFGETGGTGSVGNHQQHTASTSEIEFGRSMTFAILRAVVIPTRRVGEGILLPMPRFKGPHGTDANSIAFSAGSRAMRRHAW